MKQQVDILGTSNDLSALWTELEQYVSDGTWSLVPEKMREYAELRPGVPVLFFDCATQIPPHARMVLFRERDRISITNIWPREINELDDSQCERIAAAFLAQIIARTSVGSKVTARPPEFGAALERR
jgi:hypothetical protein